jgi:polygalacturonase
MSRTIFVCAWFANLLVLVQANDFNVLDYGAKGDGVTLDTPAIKDAIKLASAHGGRVVLPSPHTFLSGSLHMESNVIFFIEKGATLLGSRNYADYPFEVISPGQSRQSQGDVFKRQSLIAGATCTSTDPSNEHLCATWRKLTNVTIEGGGTIDGQGDAWWWGYDVGVKQRMDMVQPVYVDGLTLRDLTLIRSPAWTVHPLLCTNVLAERLTIEAGVFYNDREYNGHNVDGFDPESCSGVILRDSVIRAGDDCIAVYSMSEEMAMENMLVS